MKIRTGFVSNSSSSSFVIGLKYRPTTWQDLHRLLFGDHQNREFRPDYMKPTDSCYQEFMATSYNIAKNIFFQIEDQGVVSDKQLSKVCDPGKYPNWTTPEQTKEGKEISKQMMDRYAVRYPYCLSPTNRLDKRRDAIQEQQRKEYNKKIRERQQKTWEKKSKKFVGLKKFVVMTQSDGGKESRILAIMDSCWPVIFKNVKHTPLTAH